MRWLLALSALREKRSMTELVTDAMAEAFEAAMMADPAVRSEIDRYEPVVRKLTNESLLAIVVAARRETRRRVDASRPKPRVGIGNRG